ncbi:MAG: hypothetical protein A2150_00085 [Candidatus Muproteobacteria bacterium RBG_16_64_11]|uniref:Uncharacterized protein n=1 Tax=Candidatus Muproteobacteria bacterium RBG_16_64_11 TaxID=1817758 RepID=A0A1F6TA97_9PROT|nr:MAG: hypothetical protein A2150_00085 [Candidatus Muproteobacteria bacterium RBG_16_64_11]
MSQFLRILIVLAGLWLILGLVKRFLAKHRPAAPKPAANDDVVPCAHCGVYVPRAEAVHPRGRDYCSQAHSEADS